MLDESLMRDLFDRWERVWHDGQFDLVPSCVSENYVRHDESGDRTVTRDAYAMEIAQIQSERPGIRVVVYDHSFEGDRAWFRFAFKWHDPKTGEARNRAGMQSYRTEGRQAGGELASNDANGFRVDRHRCPGAIGRALRSRSERPPDETAATAKAAAEFKVPATRLMAIRRQGRGGTRPFLLSQVLCQFGLDVRRKFR
jgi:hypothetical protein